MYGEFLIIDPSTAAGSSSTLSESQYTHVHNLSQWYSSTTGIDDMFEVEVSS